METVLNREIKLDKAIEQAKEATRENDHTGARRVLARLTGSDFLSKGYRYIDELQNLFGYMPEGLGNLRLHTFDPVLLEELTRLYPNDIDKIKSAL